MRNGTRGIRLCLWSGALLLAACPAEPIHPERAFGPSAPDDAPAQAVRVHQPAGLGTLAVRTGEGAEAAEVACVTCHGEGVSGRTLAREEVEGEAMHADIELRHGALACNSCHAPGDRQGLRLADGREVAFADTMDLCAQCHGGQARDWRRGSHGGMSGHWDRRRGERTRNHCLDCHDAHDPAYPSMLPVLPPRDRYFLPQEAH